MSATRKLYEKVARALKAERPNPEATDAEFLVWMNMVSAASRAFYSDNASFNPERFEEACGVPA